MTGYPPSEIEDALGPFVAKLEELGIPYAIGGSVASSVYGAARSTQDVDMVADFDDSRITKLCTDLGEQYFIDADMISEAISRRSSFNVIHLKTCIKLDIFIVKDREFDRKSLARRLKENISPDSSHEFYVSSPEDIILHKIEWYVLGERISERQWNDILGVLKIRRGSLDMDYLKEWAGKLGVDNDLSKALEDAGQN